MLALLAICSAGGAAGQGGSAAKPDGWWQFSGFTMRISSPGHAGHVIYEGRLDQESHDIQIAVEASGEGKIEKGRILMVAGRVMAIQGPIAEPGYEIDALDVPILQYQLLVKVLAHVLPEGPAAVNAVSAIDHRESKAEIHVSTPSAGGGVAPPWEVRGKVMPGTEGSIEYDLTLTSQEEDEERGSAGKNIVNFQGRLFHESNTRIEDTLSLEGWKVFGVGPQSKKQGGATILDFSAAPEATAYKTVADIRKKLAADDHPGEADPTRNFTGFWKEDCEQAFGLQIKPFGSEGMYSVVFCGPGGCGDPSEGQHTFIHKDPDFQVVSEDELKIRGRQEWSTYRRCTRETNPVLKYKD